jgi:microcystin-dependent protein
MISTTLTTADSLIGTVASFPFPTAPSGWLACDGTEVAIADYQALWDRIGTLWTHAGWEAVHGAGTSGNFKLPDLSGAFLRGTGTGVVNGRDKVGPAIGEKQEDQMQGHLQGDGTGVSNPGGSISGQANGLMSWSTSASGWSNSPANVSYTSDGTNGTPRTGTESRPYNVGVLWCIKT